MLIEKFLISIALGAFPGTKREMSKSRSGEKVAGVRTFSPITLLGTTLAYLSQNYPYLVLVGAFIFSLLVVMGYYRGSMTDVGITTEVGAIVAFLIGVLCYTEPCLADVDAITLSMATLAGKELVPEVAVNAIILAAVSNIVTKTSIAVLFGSVEFKKRILAASAAVMAVRLLTILV